MNKNILLKITQCFFIVLMACNTGCDYLDVVPDNVEDLSYAFRDREKAKRYLYTCYNSIPSCMNVSYDPGVLGSGEIYTPQKTTATSRIDYTVFGLLSGNQTTNNPINNYWDGQNGGVSLYNAIRECNIFLEHVDNVYDLEPLEKKRWIAEVKVLKAYYHFFLTQMYGAVIIMDKNLPISASPEEMRLYRSPFDECITYVVNLIDEAVNDLPAQIQSEATEMGRFTQPIALAIKAKALVLSASPLFNGNSELQGVVDNRGTSLFPTQYEAQRWTLAAEACKAAIESATGVGIDLYDDTVSPFTLNDSLKHQLVLRQIIFDSWNKEYIWGATSNYSYGNVQYYSLPKLKNNWFSTSYVKSALNPTFDLVNTYYTKNGVPIDEDKEFDYEGRFKLKQSVAQDKWYIKEGVETVKLHFDREPRFYASIGFDGGIWWGNGNTNMNGELFVTSAKAGEVAGRKGNYNYSVTGYFAKKLVHYRTTVSDAAQDATVTVERTSFPMIRLADLYLLYAEALNEASEGFDATVFTYVDKVRNRAGLEGVMDAWSRYSKYGAPATKEQARKIIQQERSIELAMEGKIVWDIRRWKQGVEKWNKNILGWNSDGQNSEDFYRQVIVDQMSFQTKDYLFPIKEYNLIVNPNLVQNPGW
ncbi:MAG: RagB/SusD family nutrient uptake outer membrane protein [Marinifilaceae bacterium]